MIHHRLTTIASRLRDRLAGGPVELRLGIFGKLSRDPDYQRHWPRPTAGIEQVLVQELSFGLRGRIGEDGLDPHDFARLPFGHVGLARVGEEIVLLRLEPMPAAGFPLLLAGSIPAETLDAATAWTVFDALGRLAFAVRQADDSGLGGEIPGIVAREERLGTKALDELTPSPADDARHAAEADHVACALREGATDGVGRLGVIPVRSRTAPSQLLIVHRALARALPDGSAVRILVAPCGGTAAAAGGGFAPLLELVVRNGLVAG